MAKVNFTLIKDMHTEEKGGKYSSKKIWGSIFFTLIGLTYMLDGFGFYEINQHLFDSVLTAATFLIGATVVTAFSKKTPPKDDANAG